MRETAPPQERQFDYKARDATGRHRTGVLTASDHLQATRRLREQGLFPIEVDAVGAAPAAARRPKAQAQRRIKDAPAPRLTARARANFLTRLAKLAGAKISIDRALLIMAEGEKSAIAASAAALRLHIREGGSLVDGLRSHAQIEDAATLALVRGAEVSGEVDVALATAAGIHEQRLSVARRVTTGLMYPSLLLVVSLLSLGVIMIAIIPQFRPLVEDRMDLVPLLGRAVFALSGTLAAIWPVVLAAMLAAVAGFGWLYRRGRAGAVLAALANKIPMARNVILRSQAMMVLHSLGALLNREVTLSEALAVVADTTPEGPARAAMAEVSSAVTDGTALSTAFARTGLLEPSAVEMLRIGEETGDLHMMCTRAASEMREASDRMLERFLALFQPAMIILVGSLVGVSLYALFSAITSVNQIAF
ncbi:MAG: type II secretion system F family protein [Pseudomonadota bacterium]